MPKLTWVGCDDIDAAAKIVGPRIKSLRQVRGLTLRGLADRVGVSKNTLLRLEQGFPIAEPTLIKLCNALQTIPPNLMVSDEDWSLPYRVHRGTAGSWRIAFRKESAPTKIKDFEPIEPERERLRLGCLGFVSGFLHNLDCGIQNGKLQAAVVELYGDQERAGFRHSGEEMIFCLQGRLKFTISTHQLILEPGDAVTFWSRYRHRYESDLDCDTEIEPTRMLMVWIEDEEEAISTKRDEECEIGYAQESL
ncbi:MAG: XRE family transcriptional regulator [Fimbriimonas sp.]|nr:XRE family transcriptional regulator [Fimbriimonas sp.]